METSNYSILLQTQSSAAQLSRGCTVSRTGCNRSRARSYWQRRRPAVSSSSHEIDWRIGYYCWNGCGRRFSGAPVLHITDRIFAHSSGSVFGVCLFGPIGDCLCWSSRFGRRRQEMDEFDTTVRDDDVAIGGTSVASVIRHAFGKRWAVLGGLGFLAQMVAVMTAQVVKGAEIISFMTGMPYKIACIAPVALISLFVYSAKSEVVEGFNTVLTLVMVGGFVALLANAMGRGNIFAGLFQNADWLRLLPNTKVPFAMPIFIKLLAFGEAMPLIVERMVLGQKESSDTNSATSHPEILINDKRTAAFRRVSLATVFGAGVPLILAIVWAGISAALVDPSNPNPIFSLLTSYGTSIAVPVLLLAYGAIGTTLLGSFLAMAHFANDMICSKLGRCSVSWMLAANCLTVTIPCTLACLGPSLYLPLLAFAGAYPTTLLYGLAPSLAALTLRRKIKAKLNDSKEAPEETKVPMTPQLVPGGERTLVALVGMAIGLVGASTILASRHLLRV